MKWEEVTKNAPWSPRIWFSAEVYRGHMWVLGGSLNNPSKNWGDVWYSRDGKYAAEAISSRPELEGTP